MDSPLEELRLTLEVMQAVATLEYHDSTLLAPNQFDRQKTRLIQLEKCLRLLQAISPVLTSRHKLDNDALMAAVICPNCKTSFDPLRPSLRFPPPPRPPASKPQPG